MISYISVSCCLGFYVCVWLVECHCVHVYLHLTVCVCLPLPIGVDVLSGVLSFCEWKKGATYS